MVFFSKNRTTALDHLKQLKKQPYLMSTYKGKTVRLAKKQIKHNSGWKTWTIVPQYPIKVNFKEMYLFIKRKSPTEREFIKKYGKLTTKKLMEQGHIYNASNWGSDRGLIKRL